MDLNSSSSSVHYVKSIFPLHVSANHRYVSSCRYVSWCHISELMFTLRFMFVLKHLDRSQKQLENILTSRYKHSVVSLRQMLRHRCEHV